MERPKLEVADVFRRYGVAYREKHGASMSTAQRRVMSAIEVCRTAALGGHLERCDECGHERNCFNSCRDRHCPKCQCLARAEWIQDRQSELLDVPYFHVVFTVPAEIAAIASQNKKVVYNVLFRTTAATLTTIAADPEHLGAEIGFFAVLHNRLTFTRHLAAWKEREWVVYAKRPFAGPQQVLDYVGRYTHRVAISNNRLLDLENDQVRFQWKDYRTGGKVKTMTLSPDEFIRRFLLHVLPNGFQRIRYYGFLGNRYRQAKLDQCRRLLGMQKVDQHKMSPAEQDYRDRYEDLTGASLRHCPQCQRGRMVLVALLPKSSDYCPVTIDSS